MSSSGDVQSTAAVRAAIPAISGEYGAEGPPIDCRRASKASYRGKYIPTIGTACKQRGYANGKCSKNYLGNKFSYQMVLLMCEEVMPPQSQPDSVRVG